MLDPDTDRNQAKCPCRAVQDPGLLSSVSFPHWQIPQLIWELTTQLNSRTKKRILTSNRNIGDPIIHLFRWEAKNSPILPYQIRVDRKTYQPCIISSFRCKKTKKYIQPILAHRSNPRRPKYEERSSSQEQINIYTWKRFIPWNRTF